MSTKPTPTAAPTEIFGRVKVVIGPRSWDRKLQQEVTVDGVPEWRDVPVEVVPAGPGPEGSE